MNPFNGLKEGKVGRTVITARNEEELQMRIADLEARGWKVKQIPKPEHMNATHRRAHGESFERSMWNDRLATVKHRAVMVKEVGVENGK